MKKILLTFSCSSLQCSGSGSINQRHGSPDPDPHQNVLDPEHWLTAVLFLSFDTDTGLKQALATVNDYNPLMKDFHINDLLSATELDRIRTSVQVPLDFSRACGTLPFHYIFSYRILRLIHFTQKTCAKSALVSLILNKNFKLLKIYCSSLNITKEKC